MRFDQHRADPAEAGGARRRLAVSAALMVAVAAQLLTLALSSA